MLIHCDGCRKNFPFNPAKHRHDKTIFCAWCRNPIGNPTKRTFTLPKPNLNWIREKLAQRKAKTTALKFLNKYYPVNPLTQERDFSLNSWMKGKRPKLEIEDVTRVLGSKPSQTLLEKEVEWLESLGVKVTLK